MPLLASIRYGFFWLRHVFADGAYAGEKLQTALAALGHWTQEIVKRPATAKGFEVLSRPSAASCRPLLRSRSLRLLARLGDRADLRLARP